MEAWLRNKALADDRSHCCFAPNFGRLAGSKSRNSSIRPHEKRSLIVNINTASVQELKTLPGIGLARAKLIQEHRLYKSADDLRQLKGIGRSALEELRPGKNGRENRKTLRLGNASF